jgi:NAD(P)-dependent dehydrogenase (short-subunit alcohol dehydrogenase family)
MTNLEGRTALVTGATSGIGNAIANKLKESGANVIGVSRTETDKHKFDGKCIVIELTNEQQIKEELAKIEKPDILINCAGIAIDAKEFTETTTEEWDLTFDCNLKSMYLLTREVIPNMKKNKYGVIVNMSSVFHKGAPWQCLYATSKSAVLGFTDSLAKELGEHNIRVHSVAPGYTRTNMTQRWVQEGMEPQIIESTPLKKVGRPVDIANLVNFLCSDDSSYMTGHVTYIDGGSSA